MTSGLHITGGTEKVREKREVEVGEKRIKSAQSL